MLAQSHRRRRPSAAAVIACLALVLSLSGTAYAAHHYLLTSTKQIAPKLLRQLKGKPGPRGATGPAGPAGPAGAAGAKGAQGPGAVALGFGGPIGTATTALGTLDGYTIKASCTDIGGGDPQTDIYASSGSGYTVNFFATNTIDDLAAKAQEFSGGFVAAPSTDAKIISVAANVATQGHFDRQSGHILLSATGSLDVVDVTFTAIADWRAGHTPCQVVGEAVPGS
jgi:hypothetical protein